MNAQPPFTPKELASALAIVVMWGLNFVLMKWALVGFTPFQLGAARFALAAFPLVLLVGWPKLPWRFVAAYGITQSFGQFAFLFTALSVGMTAALASVLMQTQVFFTALFGALVLREGLSRGQRWGLLLAAFALGCFAMHFIAARAASTGESGQNALSAVTALGFALNLCAAASWAGANIVARRAQQHVQAAGRAGFDPLQFVAATSLVPIVPFALMSWAFDPADRHGAWLQAPWTAWLAVAYLAWVATVWAYTMWTTLLQRHPANRVAPFSLGVPVVGLAAGMLLLGEQVSAWQWAGAACIVAALGVALLLPRRAAAVERHLK